MDILLFMVLAESFKLASTQILCSTFERFKAYKVILTPTVNPEPIAVTGQSWNTLDDRAQTFT